ncbi:MAG TPA: hypothetical protein VGC20_10490, partial [bacterium]
AEVLDDLRAIRPENRVAKIPEAGRTRDARGAQRHGDAGVALALGHYACRLEAIVSAACVVLVLAACKGDEAAPPRTTRETP